MYVLKIVEAPGGAEEGRPNASFVGIQGKTAKKLRCTGDLRCIQRCFPLPDFYSIICWLEYGKQSVRKRLEFLDTETSAWVKDKEESS